ncbi:MAG: hypothetical protein H0S77_02150 [Spirochaetaceae bacterium]|nr:hypothetical protein [Spirochaetaceae bacterium]
MKYRLLMQEPENTLPSTPLLLQVLLPSYLLLLLLDIIFTIPNIAIISFMLASLCTIMTVVTQRKAMELVDYLIGGMLVLLLIYGKVTQGPGVSLLDGLGYSLAGFSIGILLVYSSWSKKTFRIFFIITSVLLAAAVCTIMTDLPTLSGIRKAPLTHIASIMFLGEGLLYISDFYNKRYRPAIWPALVSVVLSYCARGRAAIIISMLFLVVIIIINIRFIAYYYVDSGTHWLKYYRLPLLLALIMIVIALALLLPHLYRYSHFGQYGFTNTGRLSATTRFLNELTPKKLLTGFTPSFLATKGLPNSYLWMIATFGIFSAIPFLAILFSLYRLLPTSSLLFSLMVILAAYFLGEMLYPFRYGDILFVPLVISAFHADRIYIPGKHDEPSFWERY